MAKISRDFLVFFALSIFPIAGFSLLNYPDTEFYLPLLLMGLVVLFGLKHYHTEREQLVDYDDNLDLYSLGMIGAGALGMLVIASLIYKSFAQSLFYIPMHDLTFTFGQMSLDAFTTSALFTVVLVAPSEEVAKLCLHLSLHIWLKEKFGEGIAKVLAIFIPILTWAILHTYRNPEYQGVNMIVAVATAFTGGLIIFGVMKWRKSIMVALLTHAVYNIILIYMRYYT